MFKGLMKTEAVVDKYEFGAGVALVVGGQLNTRTRCTKYLVAFTGRAPRAVAPGSPILCPIISQRVLRWRNEQ